MSLTSAASVASVTVSVPASRGDVPSTATVASNGTSGGTSATLPGNNARSLSLNRVVAPCAARSASIVRVPSSVTSVSVIDRSRSTLLSNNNVTCVGRDRQPASDSHTPNTANSTTGKIPSRMPRTTCSVSARAEAERSPFALRAPRRCHDEVRPFPRCRKTLSSEGLTLRLKRARPSKQRSTLPPHAPSPREGRLHPSPARSITPRNNARPFPRTLRHLANEGSTLVPHAP
jgi:hypothetical protein